MTQPQKNTALVGAIAAAVLSLPLTWMTISGAQFEGPFGDLFGQHFGTITLDATGLNGYVTVGVKAPIWFIMGVAIAASVLQLMSDSKVFAIPKFAEWLAAVVAVAWTGVAIVVALFSGQATLGIGAVLGFLAAATPLACLLAPSAPTQTDDSDQDDDTT